MHLEVRMSSLSAWKGIYCSFLPLKPKSGRLSGRLPKYVRTLVYAKLASLAASFGKHRVPCTGYFRRITLLFTGKSVATPIHSSGVIAFLSISTVLEHSTAISEGWPGAYCQILSHLDRSFRLPRLERCPFVESILCFHPHDCNLMLGWMRRTICHAHVVLGGKTRSSWASIAR
jgi:hypothetical protein